MWPDRVSNPGPPTYESGALPIALRGPASTEVWLYFGIWVFEITRVNCIQIVLSSSYIVKYMYQLFLKLRYKLKQSAIIYLPKKSEQVD